MDDFNIFGNRGETPSSLKDKSVSGVKWSTISQISRQGTQLLTTVVLARLLAPSDFGLLGMATVVIGFIAIFKDLGTSAAIIQKRDLSDELLSSIFWVNAGFGTLSMAVVFFGARLGGLFYNNPEVVPILQALSVSFFISGLSILQQALLERSLAFNTLGKIEIISVVCGAIIGIGLALSGTGVWSLVFQLLTTVSATTVLLWLNSKWRPKPVFNWIEVKAVSSYSLNLTGFSIFNYFSRNADYLLIGRYLGAQDLGYYTLAYRILLFPLQNISLVIERVMFPVYSNIQKDNKRFINIYLKVAAAIALISFPLMTGVFTLSKPFISALFGIKWEPVILLIMILAPVGLIQSIGTTVGTIYKAKGRTDWLFRWGVGSGIFTIIAFIIGLRWGIVGVAAAYAAVSLGLSYLSLAIPFRLIDLKVTSLLKVLGYPTINSLIMAVVILSFNILFPDIKPVSAQLGLSVLIGIIVYYAASRINSKEQLKELWRLINPEKESS